MEEVGKNLTNDSGEDRPKVLRNKKGQLLKGVILNPEGKKLGTKNHDTEIQEAINKYAKLNNIKPEEVELRMNMTLIKNILSDDYRYFKDWKDRKYGTALQKADITSKGEKIEGITFEIIKKQNNEVENEDQRDTGEKPESVAEPEGADNSESGIEPVN